MVTKFVFAPLCPQDLSVIEIGHVIFWGSLMPPPPLLHNTLYQKVIIAISNMVFIVAESSLYLKGYFRLFKATIGYRW